MVTIHMKAPVSACTHSGNLDIVAVLQILSRAAKGVGGVVGAPGGGIVFVFASSMFASSLFSHGFGKTLLVFAAFIVVADFARFATFAARWATFAKRAHGHVGEESAKTKLDQSLLSYAVDLNLT